MFPAAASVLRLINFRDFYVLCPVTEPEIKLMSAIAPKFDLAFQTLPYPSGTLAGR